MNNLHYRILLFLCFFMINAVQAERKIIFKQLQKGSIDKELANKSETFHVGVSVSLYTEIPDLNFEKNLIALGIDSGVSDGKVLTANIASLEFLDVSYNYIKDLTGIQDFIKLVELRCFNNQLATLDVSRNLALTTLHCSKNQLKTLDVSKNIALAYLHCSRNKLARLDVSKNVALAYLFSSYNQLATLDVAKNTALAYLSCYSNQLKTLDISKNIALIDLSCESNQLTTLDVSKNVALTDMSCSSNKLSYLNLKNGHNSNISTSFIDLKNNPNLSFILVDNPKYSNANWADVKDLTAKYATEPGKGTNTKVFTSSTSSNNTSFR